MQSKKTVRGLLLACFAACTLAACSSVPDDPTAHLYGPEPMVTQSTPDQIVNPDVTVDSLPAPARSRAYVKADNTSFVGHSLEDEVIVIGDDADINCAAQVEDPKTKTVHCLPRRTPAKPARFMDKEAQHTKLTRADWHALNWSDKDFDRVRDNNMHLCTRTTAYILRVEDLIKRAEAKRPELKKIRDRYIALATDIRIGSYTRTGANLLSTIIGFAGGFGTPYGVMNGAQNLGSEMQGQAYDKSQMLSRDTGIFYTDVMSDYQDFNILALEAYSDYFGMMDNYCVHHMVNTPVS